MNFGPFLPKQIPPMQNSMGFFPTVYTRGIISISAGFLIYHVHWRIPVFL